MADDEMLFIIIHQAYELWFKQILHELDIVRRIFRQEGIPNSSPDIYNSVHRLKRICSILEIAVMQMTVMETMTPLDFLDFRDLLRPASGFQSIQFKMIEAALGLHYGDRHGQNYYLSQLSQADIDRVKKAESEQSLLVLIDGWLGRMPFLKKEQYWPDEMKVSGSNTALRTRPACSPAKAPISRYSICCLGMKRISCRPQARAGSRAECAVHYVIPRLSAAAFTV